MTELTDLTIAEAAEFFMPVQSIYRSLRILNDIGLGYLHLGQPSNTLSGGEAQRVKLSSELAKVSTGRTLYILDEPTIGLDLTAQRAIREFLLAYRAQQRPAMILTSHYMEDIQRLCKRIVIIDDGQFLYDGPLDRVARTYATRKVITAHLRASQGRARPDGLDRLGEVLAADSSEVRLRVERDRVAEVSARLLADLPDTLKQEYRKSVPLQRFADPAEVAYAVRALCAREAAYITGSVLDVTGGP